MKVGGHFGQQLERGGVLVHSHPAAGHHPATERPGAPDELRL